MSIVIVYGAYLLLGALAGVLSGLLGIGGGSDCCPLFTCIAPLCGYS